MEFDLSNFFVDLGTMATLTIAVAAWVNRLLTWDGAKAQAVSWAVAVAVAFLGYFLDYGVLADASVVETLLYGVGAAAVANRVFSQEVVKAILEVVRLRLPKPSTTNNG